MLNCVCKKVKGITTERRLSPEVARILDNPFDCSKTADVAKVHLISRNECITNSITQFPVAWIEELFEEDYNFVLTAWRTREEA